MKRRVLSITKQRDIVFILFVRSRPSNYNIVKETAEVDGGIKKKNIKTRNVLLRKRRAWTLAEELKSLKLIFVRATTSIKNDKQNPFHKLFHYFPLDA